MQGQKHIFKQNLLSSSNGQAMGLSVHHSTFFLLSFIPLSKNGFTLGPVNSLEKFSSITPNRKHFPEDVFAIHFLLEARKQMRIQRCIIDCFIIKFKEKYFESHSHNVYVIF